MPYPKGLARSSIAATKALLARTKSELLELLLAEPPPGVAPSDYDRFLAREKAAAIDAALKRLDSDLGGLVDGAAEASARKGVADTAAKVQKLVARFPAIGVDARALQFVQDFAAVQVAGVVQEVRTKIASAAQRAVAGALDVRGFQREIAKAFEGDVTEGRIERILRTETAQAYTQAQAAADEQLVELDVDLDIIKVWSATDDSRTREDHAAIDGQERELWQNFDVGGGATASTPPGGAGEPANAPLDPSLGAAQAVNCRCTVLYVPREKARQPYIERDRERARAAKRAALSAA